MTRARGRLAALALGCACQLPPRGGDVVDPSVNACLVEGEVNGSCGPDSICLGAICRANAADSLPVVFELTRSQLVGASNAQPSILPSTLTLEELRALSVSAWTQSGAPAAVNFVLPTLASREVTLLGPDPSKNQAATSARGCFFDEQIASDRTLPVHVSLRPAAVHRGLPLATFARNATDPRDLVPQLSLQASLQVPPATYDLYLRPTVSLACPIPPLLVHNLDVAGVAPLQFDLTQLTLETLLGHFTTDPSLDLGAWSARLVDAATGLTVSTSVGFVPTATPGKWEMGVSATEGFAPLEYYSPLLGPSLLFLVLTPPAGLRAPRLAWSLLTLDLFNKHEVTLDLTALSLATVDVELRSERGDGPGPQATQLLLTSSAEPGALSGVPPGALALFSVGPGLTDADGLAQLNLLPGRYDAMASPLEDPSLDIGRRSFTFLPSPDGGSLAGFAVPVPERPALTVPILPPASDTPLAGVPFSVSPSAMALGSLAASLFDAPALDPRASAGRTDADGYLRTVTDSGRYDVTLRLPAGRGFPWLVKAGVDLPLATPGPLRVSLPVEVQGSAFDLPVGNTQRRPLTGARLRAYARLASGVHVQIAEGVVDSAGGYRLLLPSRL